MKRSMKKLITICLGVSVVLSGMSTAFAAQSFTDVPESHWANSVVEKMSSMGAVPGYEDATFKPAQEVSKLEVIVALYKTVKASGLIDSLNEDALVSSHNATMTSLNIPKTLEPYGATYPAVAYALEKEIIVKDELKFFIQDGKLTTAKKIDASIFMGKMLNVFKQENLNKIISFDFKDAFDINHAASPYVNILVEYNVVSSKGNAEGKFVPKETATRQLLVAMLAGFYNALDTTSVPSSGGSDLIITPGQGESVTGGSNTESGSTGTTTQPKSLFSETGTFKGSVGRVYTDQSLVEIKDSQGVAKMYDAENAKITMNGKALAIVDLEQGQDVTISVIKGELVQLVIDRDFDLYEGVFVEVSRTLSGNGGAYRVLTIKEDSGSNEYFKIYETTSVDKNDKTVGVDAIEVGDRIIVNADKTDAKKISVYSKDNQVSGILNKDTDFQVGSTVSVKLTDGSLLEQKINQGFELVTRGDESIRKGDILKVTTEYGKIVKVEGTGMISEDQGKIKEIIISETSKITILTQSGDLKTYPISEKVDMLYQDIAEKIEIYDLRLGQDVSLNMNAFGIEKLTVITKAEQTAEKIKFSGVITELYKTTNNLRVKDGAGNVWMVGIKEGSDTSILEFSVGDNVYLYGIQLSDEFFEAELILGF